MTTAPSETAVRIAREFPASAKAVEQYLDAAGGCETCTRVALQAVVSGGVGILAALMARPFGARCTHGTP